VQDPENTHLLSEVPLLVEAIALLPFVLNLWQTQSVYWSMLQARAAELPVITGEAIGLIPWGEAAKILGQRLFFNVPAVLAEAKGDL